MNGNLNRANIKGDKPKRSNSKLFEAKAPEVKVATKKEHKLLPEVAAKYDCTIQPKPLVLPDGRRIDLRTISLKKADKLVAEGLKVLVLKGTSETLAPEKTKGK